MPAVRLATVPAVDYCAAKRDRALMEKVVDAVFDDIVEALTKPLTEEEKRSYVKEYDYSNKTFTGDSYHEAYEKFLDYCAANALTDGLPVVPPTPENVAWMMTGTTYDRDKVIGYNLLDVLQQQHYVGPRQDVRIGAPVVRHHALVVGHRQSCFGLDQRHLPDHS